MLNHLLFSPDPFSLLMIFLDRARIHFYRHDGRLILTVLASASPCVLLADLLPLFDDLSNWLACEIPLLFICYFTWHNGFIVIFKVHKLKSFTFFAPSKVFGLLL